MEKKDLLKETVQHIDIKKYNSTELIDAMRRMSFTSRDTARAADIFMKMVAEKECTNILTIATGVQSDRRYAVDFIDSVKWIKRNLPGASGL